MQGITKEPRNKYMHKRDRKGLSIKAMEIPFSYPLNIFTSYIWSAASIWPLLCECVERERERERESPTCASEIQMGAINYLQSFNFFNSRDGPLSTSYKCPCWDWFGFLSSKLQTESDDIYWYNVRWKRDLYSKYKYNYIIKLVNKM
jgi:hypothetical protein